MRAALRSLFFALCFTPSCSLFGVRHAVFPWPTLAISMLFTELWFFAGVLPIAIVWFVLFVRRRPSKLGFASYVD